MYFGLRNNFFELTTYNYFVLSANGENYYVCPRDFILVDRSCYFFSTSPDTWRNAYFNCKDKNSELALVKKKWEDKALRGFLKTGKMGDN
ncbi:hypothetical protein Phum_PHUM458550 [Pediculus humanus corporis]|uniref:C-type lectin domain-containing protein n=1 Tax=Pediculus humanus subsp. corporis TaxID=121224 RepID=E0VV46_PEDHC|nr:uncharacterized protein Phum_PHUM458550 [Pediculus humanus corporis]EEB17252.1 hypothetical protein Phum_PHUM458550 [Pediculus humanus corporis]